MKMVTKKFSEHRAIIMFFAQIRAAERLGQLTLEAPAANLIALDEAVWKMKDVTPGDPKMEPRNLCEG